MGKKHYNHAELETKWNKRWAEEHLYEVDPNDATDKFYCLDMFPYPSGEGLHVGHWRGYVLSDFYSRYAQLNGKTVLHPIGFDAFGLPAENAAIKSKTHPREFINTAIPHFTKQLQQIGAAYDWSKVINTSDPAYYRWTQWLFLQMFKHGLVEKRKGLVNWCPKDQTVLANEQVVNGCCERCGSVVTKKELSQWYVKTTALADELLEGLEHVQWPEHVKTLQRNWIGRSEGATIQFQAEQYLISVFTTRPDTLFGVTALVLSPDHPLVEPLTVSSQRQALKAYLTLVQSKTNIDRQQQSETEKTAVFTGSYAHHPLTGEKLPIWVADYVLIEYGTGVVMSVPAHDERDYLFAKTHELPMKEVIVADDRVALPFAGEGRLVESEEFSGMYSLEAQNAIVEKLAEKNIGTKTVTYRLRDWLVSRQRYWGTPIPIVYDPDGQPHPVKDEHLPLMLPNDVDFLPGGESPLAHSKEYHQRAEKLYGKRWQFDTDTLDTFVDSSWYYLRYLSSHDERQAFDPDLVKRWFPVDLYVGGIEHATLHLLYARFVTRFLANYGYIDSSKAEPFSQLYNIGMITLHGAKMSKSKGNVVAPDPLIEHYGTDALRGYELFVGPMDVEAEWNVNGINGIHRFLIKVFQLVDQVSDTTVDKPAQRFSKYLVEITKMAKEFRLNTYISEAMKLVNDWSNAPIPRETFKLFLVTLAPIFPYLAEELWETIGEKESIFHSRWPNVTKPLIETIDLSVRINHKHIGVHQVNGNESESEVISALKDTALGDRLSALKVLRTIYKPGQFIDFLG